MIQKNHIPTSYDRAELEKSLKKSGLDANTISLLIKRFDE